MAQNITIVNTEYNSSAVPVNALFSDTIKIKKDSKLGLKSFHAAVDQGYIIPEDQLITFTNVNMEGKPNDISSFKFNRLKQYNSIYEMLENIKIGLIHSLGSSTYGLKGRNFEIHKTDVDYNCIRLVKYPIVQVNNPDVPILPSRGEEPPPYFLNNWIESQYNTEFVYKVLNDKTFVIDTEPIDEKVGAELATLGTLDLYLLNTINLQQYYYQENETNFYESNILFTCHTKKNKLSCEFQYTLTTDETIDYDEETYLKPEIKINLFIDTQLIATIPVEDEFLNYKSLYMANPKSPLNVGPFTKNYPYFDPNGLLIKANPEGTNYNLYWKALYNDFTPNPDGSDINHVFTPAEFPATIYPLGMTSDNFKSNITLTYDGITGELKSVDFQVDNTINTPEDKQYRIKYLGGEINNIPMNPFNFHFSRSILYISGISQTNPAVITSASHGLETGDSVYISNVGGMTQVNNIVFIVGNITENTFELNGIDSTGYTAYTIGGLVGKKPIFSSLYGHIGNRYTGEQLLCDKIFPGVDVYDKNNRILMVYQGGSSSNNLGINLIKVGNLFSTLLNNNRQTDYNLVKGIGDIKLDFSKAGYIKDKLGFKDEEMFKINNNNNCYELLIPYNINHEPLQINMPSQIALDIDNIKIKSYKGFKSSNDPLNRGRRNTLAIFNGSINKNSKTQDGWNIFYESVSDAYIYVDINEDIELTSLNYRFYTVLDNKPLIADKLSFNLINID